MKTVGIITIFDLNNYGNRLQNYAMHAVLSEMDLSAKTYTFQQFDGNLGIKVLAKWRIHQITRCMLTQNKDYWQCYVPRLNSFRLYTRKYIPTEMVADVSLLEEKADFFVLGSDQVWNVSWYGDREPQLFLLEFAKNEQKVCFAPSFGIEQLPEEWHSVFAKNLSTFKGLSVREDAGAKIIKDLTGKEAEVLIDPTMMLDAADWMKAAKRPRRVNTRRPYILTYVLGEKTDAMMRDIVELQSEKKRDVLHLVDKEYPNLYACGPSEFVYLVSKADLVITDSFHACVFSILFGKPFLVYDRKEEGLVQMNSRLDTLLGSLGLQRKYKGSGLENDVFECDYDDAYQRLESLRGKAHDYLRRMLGV